MSFIEEGLPGSNECSFCRVIQLGKLYLANRSEQLFCHQEKVLAHGTHLAMLCKGLSIAEFFFFIQHLTSTD